MRPLYSDPIFRYSLNFMVRALLSSSSSIFISGESAYISARKTPISRTACNTVIRWSISFLSFSSELYVFDMLPFLKYVPSCSIFHFHPRLIQYPPCFLTCPLFLLLIFHMLDIPSPLNAGIARLLLP